MNSIYSEKIDYIEKIIKKMNLNIISIDKKNESKLIYLEPPFIKKCSKNCDKKACYQKGLYYFCWFHIYND